MKKTIIGISVLLLIILAAVSFIFKDEDVVSEVENNEEVACTLEAKICADGSSVGRQGPNCEFAKCPEELNIEENSNQPTSSDDNSSKWTTYINKEWKYSFEYPSNLELKEEMGGFKVNLSGPDGKEYGSEFYSVFVIQYPEVEDKNQIAEKLFNVANLPDGKVAWLKDPRFFKYEEYKIDSQMISFGKDNNEAIKSRENSIKKDLGEYRSIIYVLRKPAIYRVTYDLKGYSEHKATIDRINSSFKIID